ncbi:MAG: hypothetical protein CVV45_09430 [Spirochaetae bacterium HGW-Spirochaetae-10]|nr:MAG: hypothetical protein CVV45_09430 [Spirochaetae bacterium HGW-Spirochaetae-10]
MIQKVYSIDEVAEILKLHPITVRRRIASGEIAAIRVGRQYRISQATLDQLCGMPELQQAPATAEAPGGAVDSRLAHESRESPGADQATAMGAFVSAVIDIDEISREQGMRLTNTIMAVMNSGATSGSRVECVYYEGRRALKVILTGELSQIPELMLMIRGLLTEQGPF